MFGYDLPCDSFDTIYYTDDELKNKELMLSKIHENIIELRENCEKLNIEDIKYYLDKLITGIDEISKK